MNALLIYPRNPDAAWAMKHVVRFIGKRSVSPPLGLLTVAALLPRAWPKRLVDMNVRRLTDKDLAWADSAFIGGMGIHKESVRRITVRCKRAGLRVVAGGPLFIIGREDFPAVDHFVLNEGELTLPPFLADLARGRAKRVYAASDFADIRTTPAPLWALADLRRYSMVDVQFSRGCPHDCEFCSIPRMLGRRVRTKSAGQVIAELDALYRLGWRRTIWFADDNFNGHPRSLKSELLPALTRWRRHKPAITFNAEVTIDLADDDRLMRRMVEAGFHRLFVGIETPDEDNLRECGKRQNRDRDLMADVKRLHRAGLEVSGGFILGFDHDTPATFQRQIDFIQQSGIMMAMVSLLQALPHTRLYERLEAEGRLTGHWSGDTGDGTTNVVPRMGLRALRQGHKHVVQHLYAPEQFYRRLKQFLRDYGASASKIPMQMEDLLTALRVLWRLGVVGEERVPFLRTLLWTYVHRPRLLPHVYLLAIIGHHFRRTFQESLR